MKTAAQVTAAAETTVLVVAVAVVPMEAVVATGMTREGPAIPHSRPL